MTRRGAEGEIEGALVEPWPSPLHFRDPRLGKLTVHVPRPAEAVPLGKGPLLLPRLFTVEPRARRKGSSAGRRAADGDLRFPLLIDVEVEGGRPQAVAVRRRPGGLPLTAERLRCPVDALVKAAAYGLAIEPTGRRVGRREIWRHVFQRPLGGEEIERALRPRGRGAKLSDQFLGEVAAVYRQALAAGRPPTQAVAEAFYGSRSSAGRWVMEARRRGLLGRAPRERVAGERRRA
jgi:hypothetical protein